MWRGGTAYHNINPLKFPRPVLELESTTSEFLGQHHGLCIRAIGYKDAPRTTRHQGARGFFARLSRSDDHDIALAQVAEDLFRQLNRGGADRDAAALDVGFGSN